MREIEFRGISYENNKFVYGWLHQTKYKCKKFFIRTFPNEDDEYDDVVVNINTVGQYTGIKDCEGVKIFEGDIVEYWYRSVSGTASSTAIVKFYDGAFQLEDIDDSDTTELLYLAEDLKVIGNVWENPELLEFDDDDDEFWKVIETLDTIED